MPEIIPHLWFDREAAEAAEFYVSLFPRSSVDARWVLHDTPSGDAEQLSIRLAGQRFLLISAGPLFRFNPSVSFRVACDVADEVDALWARLSDGGKALMPLQSYPFSERFGWIEDRYGLSWQPMLVEKGSWKQKITPALLFTGDNAGKAEEALRFWASVFRNSAVEAVMRYGPGEEPDREGALKLAKFRLEGYEFSATDSAYPHGFGFNEAVSFLVNCPTQAEIDYYWDALTADPSAEACGWLKDKYGLSWQINPGIMDRMLKDASPEQLGRVVQAFLPMKKLDIAALERAYMGGEEDNGEPIT